MTLLRVENRTDGRLSVTLDKGRAAQVVGFPREFNLDLAIHELDSDSIIVAGLLIFGSKLWRQNLEAPIASETLSERMFEAGYPAEWMPVLERSGSAPDYSLSRQNTLVVLPVNSERQELDISGPGRLIYAHPLDVADWTGRVFGSSHLFFGTNLPLVASASGINEAVLRLATGVLIANDLRIGKISIPNASPEVSSRDLLAMRALSSSIGLVVDFDENFWDREAE